MTQPSPRNDTLAALQAAQIESVRQTREEYQAAAGRYVDRMSSKHHWPEGDAEEVRSALGIAP